MENKHRYRIVDSCDSDTAVSETQDCCDVGTWSHWSECENGSKMRSRDTLNCPSASSTESVECCTIGDWSEWSSCQSGKQTRTRTNINCSSDVAVSEEKIVVS